MKRNRLQSVLASVATLAVTGGVLAATAGTAAALTPTPAWEPDPNALGTLTFFDSNGQVVTGGSNLNHIVAYAQGSTADTAGGTLAALQFANPTPSADPGTWPVGSASSNKATPPSGAPGALSSSSTPVATATGPTDANLSQFIAGHTANTTSGYANVYQVRVATSGGSGGSSSNGQYWESDIQVNPSTGTWYQIYPAVAVDTTTSTPTATDNTTSTNNATSSTQGDSVTFSATESAYDGTHPGGTIQFKDGSTNLGSPVAVNSSGVATTTTTTLSQAPHSITAVFTPTSTTNYNGSTSGALAFTVNKAVTPTTTTLNISGNSTTGTDSVLSGTVSPSAAAGTVSFYDNGSSTAINSSPVAVSGGNYTYTLSGGFAAGSHSVVAKFTPTDPTSYGPSSSQAVGFSTVQGAAAGSTCSQTGSNCIDTQTIQATVPTGTLVISTPYTDANPLDLGTLALNPTGTEWTGHATFKCITITDSSSGGSPFVASAVANTLSQVSGTGNSAQNTTNAFTTISGENVGLTALGQSTGTCPSGAAPTNSYTKTVTPSSNPAADPAVNPTDTGSAGLGKNPHTILTGTSGGVGTATYDGTLTLNAPTNTAAGVYKGTVVFTVTD